MKCSNCGAEIVHDDRSMYVTAYKNPRSASEILTSDSIKTRAYLLCSDCRLRRKRILRTFVIAFLALLAAIIFAVSLIK